MHSLRLRLFLTIALVSLIGLVGVGLFSTRTMTLQVEQFDRGPQRVDIGSVKRALDAAYRRNKSWIGINTLLRKLAGAQHLKILLISSGGSLIGSSEPAMRHARFQFTPAGSLRITFDGSGAADSRNTQRSELLLRAPPTRVGAKRDGAWLYVLPAAGLPAPSRQPLAGHVGEMIWIAVAIAAIAATLAALVLSAQILHPVEALTRAAEDMARGNLDARVAATGKDEIGALGRAFNTMAESLARLEKLRKDLIADVAHELRTPLTHLTARLEAIQDGHIPMTPAVMASISEDVSMLTRLVGDLQDLALADADQLGIQPQSVSLRNAVDSVVASYQSAIVPIGIDLPADLPPVLADPARLNQVLRNLISNALTHVSVGGRVVLSAAADDGHLRVSIHNDGAALSDRDLSLVFERFYRADKSRSRLTGGAGLGLAIVKQLVEAHGGKVWAENSPPSGVSVYFTLPLAEPPS